MMENEDYEVHVDICPSPDRTAYTEDGQKWKSFKIEKCKECGKIPILKKNFDFTDNRRYQIHCCGRTAGSAYETACIVTWNSMQEEIE